MSLIRAISHEITFQKWVGGGRVLVIERPLPFEAFWDPGSAIIVISIITIYEGK